MKQIFNLFMRG